MIAVASGFSTAHAVLTPSAQPHVHALSGSTVSLCPRICLCFEVQFGVLDALKAPLAFEDQLVQHPGPHCSEATHERSNGEHGTGLPRAGLG